MNNNEWNLLIERWNNFLNESLKSSDDKEIKFYSNMLQNVILDFKESFPERFRRLPKREKTRKETHSSSDLA